MTLERTVAERALGWVGTPYVHQASVRGVGTDCLGLVRGVRRELGLPDVPVSPYAPGWGETDERGEPLLEAARVHLVPVEKREPRTGDVVVFRMLARGPAKHCGIVVSPDRFVHAYSGVGTVVSALSEPWRRRVAALFGFRLNPTEEARS